MGCDAVLGEMAFFNDYLAFTTGLTSATDRLQFNAQLLGSLEQVCACCHLPFPS
jgi:hypothetical protein